METINNLKAAVCQFDVKPGAVEANIVLALAAIRRASDQGAGLLILPELWSCGFDIRQMAACAEQTPGILDRIGGIAAEKNVMIAGSLPERSGDAVFNTLFVIDRTGKMAGFYRKIHLFSLMDEDRCFSRGDKPVICRTGDADFGMMICYDLRFPELCRRLAVNGARMVIVSAQWPAVRIDHWDILLRARAIENQIFVIATNACGAAGTEFNGHSQIISPTGEILAHAGEAQGEALALIDFTEIENFRNRFSTIAERVPDAYEP